MRNSMIFYRSFYDAIKNLPNEEQLKIYNAIFSYGLDFNEPELNGVSASFWTLIKPQIDANIKRFENGKKPKQKQTESKNEAKEKQKQSKTLTNNNVNENENVNENNKQVNIKERKNKFYVSLSEFTSEYPKELLRDFFDYWTEHGEKDIKMRFEKEKTFGISQRLKTWYKRNPKQYEKTEIIDPLVEYVYRKTGIR